MDKEKGKKPKKYFSLSLESLRILGDWTADCAEKVLPVFEQHAASDPRPRVAIEGIREFAAGGKRTARLRVLALAAHAAAREAPDHAAAAAARAAGSAAASAYTHPLADVQQTKHIVGSAAYAALALELDRPDDPDAANKIVRWAVAHAPREVRDILRQMPSRLPGTGRLNQRMFQIDSEIRSR